MMNNKKKLKCYLISLGCPKNLVDSEVMLGLLVQEGYSIAYSEEEAEIIIVNTCGFIEKAKEESIDTILEMAQLKEKGSCKALIVTGCLSQRYSEDLKKEIPEVDAFIGTGEFHRINEAIEKLAEEKKLNFISSPEVPLEFNASRIITTPFFYTYLKIADGCNHKCSFCVIPDLRGKYRSREMSHIIKEAKELSERGVKELILIAQDTSQYGKDLKPKTDLPTLLRKLEKVKGIEWIRVLYFYPTSISEEILLLMKKSKKICNYIDLPLQHCSGKILKMMGRRGNKESLLELINKIRSVVPDVTLRTSLIAGFPGETEEDFEELLDFIKKAEFDRLGAFDYSREEKTKAAGLKGQIKKKVKKERLHRIMTLQKEISLEKNKSLTGSVLEVLIEEIFEEGPYQSAGRTRRDAPDIDGRIYLINCNGMPGDIIKAKVIDGNEYDLIGIEAK